MTSERGQPAQRQQRARSHLGPAASPAEVEVWRERTLESLRPSLARALLGPFAAVLAIFGAFALYRAIGEIGMVLVVAGFLVWAAVRSRGSKVYPSGAALRREYEESLEQPGLHRSLTAIERVVFGVAAFLVTPAIGRLLIGDFKGEVGFGGIAILFAAFVIALFCAFFVSYFQADYMQDRYRARLAIDAAVIGLVFLLMTGQVPAINLPTPFTSGNERALAPATETIPATPTTLLQQEIEVARADPSRLGRVEELLARGARLDVPNAAGETPLMAVVRGARAGDRRDLAQLRLARLLLEKGANPNSLGPTGQPVFMAALDDPALFGLLFEHGADVRRGLFWKELGRRPPARVVALVDQMPAIPVADNVPGPYCMALRYRDPKERTDLIQYFARRGARPRSETCGIGKTPLAIAIGSARRPGDIQLIDQLLAAGASLEEEDFSGETLLMRAGYRPDLVRHLIGKGAAVNVVSTSNRTALDHYERERWTESAAILVAAGGKRARELVPDLAEPSD